MEASSPSLVVDDRPARVSAAALVGAGLLATVVGSAVVYKATGAMKALAKAHATGTMGPKARWLPVQGVSSAVRPFLETANYFSWILIALLFGVAIGALVKAAVPARWFARMANAPGPLGVVLGAVLGAPLMLCSCCIAPVFDGAYSRTRKLGPSLALMLAAPGLNPADLAITFLVFPRGIAVARLVLSLVAVLGISATLGRAEILAPPLEACAVDEARPTWAAFGRSLARSFTETARRSLPAMVVGAFLSVLLIQAVPLASVSRLGGAPVAALLVAGLGMLVALPTFGEIPLGLALLLAGAPKSAVVALLVAGPIINLPSLLVLRRTVSARVAMGTGLGVAVIAFLGGLAAGGILS